MILSDFLHRKLLDRHEIKEFAIEHAPIHRKPAIVHLLHHQVASPSRWPRDQGQNDAFSEANFTLWSHEEENISKYAQLELFRLGDLEVRAG
jgi:hypothetical protein